VIIRLRRNPSLCRHGFPRPLAEHRPSNFTPFLIILKIQFLLFRPLHAGIFCDLSEFQELADGHPLEFGDRGKSFFGVIVANSSRPPSEESPPRVRRGRQFSLPPSTTQPGSPFPHLRAALIRLQCSGRAGWTRCPAMTKEIAGPAFPVGRGC